MDPEAQKQISDLIELREIHYSRVRVLEQQAARFGIETPPHVQGEIEEIHTKINEINKSITKLSLKEAQWLKRVIPPEDKLNSGDDDIYSRISAVNRYISDLESAMSREINAIHFAINYVQERIEQYQQRDDQERKHRQSKLDKLLYFIVFLLLLLIVAVLVK